MRVRGKWVRSLFASFLFFLLYLGAREEMRREAALSLPTASVPGVGNGHPISYQRPNGKHALQVLLK